LILLEGSAREGPGDKNQNRRRGRDSTNHISSANLRRCDVLLVVVGGPIRIYKRLVLLLSRPHVSARTPLVAWAYLLLGCPLTI